MKTGGFLDQQTLQASLCKRQPQTQCMWELSGPPFPRVNVCAGGKLSRARSAVRSELQPWFPWPSSIQSSSVGTAKWEACFLALAEHVRDSGSRVTSQKQWDKRDPAHHILGRSHLEAGCWGWVIQLHHPRVIHRPLH
jgi:hypothetical protein